MVERIQYNRIIAYILYSTYSTLGAGCINLDLENVILL